MRRYWNIKRVFNENLKVFLNYDSNTDEKTKTEMRKELEGMQSKLVTEAVGFFRWFMDNRVFITGRFITDEEEKRNE